MHLEKIGNSSRSAECLVIMLFRVILMNLMLIRNTRFPVTDSEFLINKSKHISIETKYTNMTKPSDTAW